MTRRFLFAVFVFSFAAASCARQAAPPDLQASLLALDAAYVDAWLLEDPKDQEDAIMRLFSDDAYVMPGAGADPLDGKAALRDFWFHEDAPPTTVTRFEHDVRRIEATGDLGVVSGRYVLEFVYDGASFAREGNYVTVARYLDGAWRITNSLWNDRAL